MKEKTAQKLIQKTKDDYNLIAEQFASTRKYNWPEVTKTLHDILKNFSKEEKLYVLDVGCGSGRVYDFFKGYNVEYHGIDLSEELIKIAKKSYPRVDFVVGDATSLPYEDNSFDIVLSIATIHHIPSKRLRNKFNKEVFRVLKPRGWAFIETWYFWNKPKFVSEILKSYLGRVFTSKISFEDSLSFGDFYRPWKVGSGELITKRYLYAWTIKGLKKSLKQTGFTKIQVYNFYRKTRNLNIIAQKPDK